METHTPETGDDTTDVSRRNRPKTLSNSRESVLWRVFGKKVPRSESVFICQMLLIYIVVIVSLFNLSKDNGPSHLWVALLSSALGYTLPNPSIDARGH